MAAADASHLDQRAAGGAPVLIPLVPLGMALGLFLAISYVACVLLYLLFPDAFQGHAMLALLLPGFKLLTWPSFALGLIEFYAYGWYAALVFAPIYNFFVARNWGARSAPPASAGE
jgi:hypothetical protein